MKTRLHVTVDLPGQNPCSSSIKDEFTDNWIECFKQFFDARKWLKVGR